MTTIFPSQKPLKTSFWTKVEDSKPKDEEALYLIVQSAGETQMLGFAWYRKDGNGEFQFTKEEVTHWAPAPKLPEA